MIHYVRSAQIDSLKAIIIIFGGAYRNMLIARSFAYERNTVLHTKTTHLLYNFPRLPRSFEWQKQLFSLYEPPHDKLNKMTCAPSEDSDQPGHPSSLIWIFAVRMKKHWALNYLLSAQWRLWADCADAQTDLSLRSAHMSFCWFCRAAAHTSLFSWTSAIYVLWKTK